ncbi:hypothetical protein DXG01_003991 [Tephrocybe rancida]|nr:hypothetical protein DXG01_003991 [Tephrocybe rancida]
MPPSASSSLLRAFHALTDIVHHLWVLYIPLHYASQAAPLLNSQLMFDRESSTMQHLDIIADTEIGMTAGLPLDDVHIPTSPLFYEQWDMASHPSTVLHESIPKLMAPKQPDTGDADIGSGAMITASPRNDAPLLTHTSLPSTPPAHIPEHICHPSHVIHDNGKSLWTMFIHDRHKEWLFLVSASGIILG